MSDQTKAKATDLLDDIYDSYSIELEDGESRLPGSIKEIKRGEEILAEVKALNCEDEEVKEHIEQTEFVLSESQKRKFAGSKWIMIVLGLFIVVMMYMSVYEPLTSENTVAMAGKMLKANIRSYEGTVARYKNLPDTDPNKEERLEYAQERLAEFKEFTPETYKEELDSRDTSNAISNFFQWGFWALMLVAYYFASMSPQFLIDKRLAQMNLAVKGGSVVKKIVFAFLGFFIAMPSVTETRVHWSDGSKSTEYGFEGLIIKLIGILVIVAVVIWAMMFMLPWLIIINYLRNYQYEKIDQFFDNLFGKFKSDTGKAVQE